MKFNIAIIISFLLVAASSAFAQTKIEKFCVVTTRPKNGYTLKRVAVVSYGEQLNLFNFKDSTMLTSLKKVNDLTTDADVLNYITSIGWHFVNIIGAAGGWENLYFKKEFDKSELVDQ